MSDSTESTSDNTPDRISQMQSVQKEAFETFLKKNKDYGDAFATYGPVGVIVRIGDKIARLTSVTSSGVNLVQDETIRDTLMDLHNYAAMAVMLLDEGKNVNDTVSVETINLPCAPEVVEEISEQEQVSHDSVGKICPFCTYMNNPSASICEMCYAQLEGIQQ